MLYSIIVASLFILVSHVEFSLIFLIGFDILTTSVLYFPAVATLAIVRNTYPTSFVLFLYDF